MCPAPVTSITITWPHIGDNDNDLNPGIISSDFELVTMSLYDNVLWDGMKMGMSLGFKLWVVTMLVAALMFSN